ncbi:helix-turn-helix transcriptional regulator [Mycobacterium florentinum]|nr:LuxR C-terminal-related transcriptional regulator [Mycobacterium florentinum]BBX80744.1 LuxR family transcriptional regulator [Mycobacterium florentinum]
MIIVMVLTTIMPVAGTEPATRREVHLTRYVQRDVDQQWPFVGRVQVFEQLRQLLFDQRAPVLLAGPAGVGKTRLATELLDRAEQQGFPTVHVTATRAAAEIPFGALAGMLFADDEPLPMPVSIRAEWMRSAVRRITAMGGELPMVLLVDDIQLLDSVSATLIHHAVAANACLLLATMRTGDAVPDPILSLYKDGYVTRVDVGVLDADEVEAILRAVFGGIVESSTVQQFAVRSGGNIFYLRELVRGALRSATLVLDENVWRLTGRAPLSARLIELVDARLAELTPDERNILDVLAYGEPLELQHLRAFVAGGAALAERLEARGLVASRHEGRRLMIRMAHPVYTDALLHELTAVRRSRLARELADIAEDVGDIGTDGLIRTATWCLEGGLRRPELMLRAAYQARWTYDFGVAARLARAASEDGAGFEAELLCGQLAYLQGRAGDADVALAGLANAAANDDQRTRIALARLECAMFSGRIEHGIRIAESAEAATHEPALRDQITARRAGLILAATGPDAAARVAAPLLKTSEGPALVWACLITSAGCARLGRFDEAMNAADVGHAAQARLAAPLDNYPWLHIFFRGDAQMYSGQFDSALTTARHHYAEAVSAGSIEAQAYFAWQLAKSVGERGNVEESVRYAREAALLFRDLGRPTLQEQSLIDLVIAHAIGGDGHSAGAALAELDKLRLARSYYAVEVLRARAWTCIANGELSSARDNLERAAELGERIGDRVGALDCLHTLARLGHTTRLYSRAADIAEHVQGQLAPARLANISALETKDWQRLHTVAQEFADMGAHLLAAEAAAEAVVVARKKNASTQQVAILRRLAARLRQDCPGAMTPSLQTAQLRVTLTVAEADAARLAAAGLSNKRIAEKLFLSTRTVEGQLQRAYEKLCIGGRSELATALAEHSL